MDVRTAHPTLKLTALEFQLGRSQILGMDRDQLRAACPVQDIDHAHLATPQLPLIEAFDGVTERSNRGLVALDGMLDPKIVLLGLLTMVVEIFDFGRCLKQCRMMDIQPERPM
jgi:hypothetical protein